VRSRQAILFFSPAGRSVPDFVTAWVNGKGLPVTTLPQAALVQERVLRALPTLVVVDGDSAGDEGIELCARLKGDAYTAIVPLAVVTNRHATDAVRRWFAAGADEVITPLFEPGEQAGRLDALVTRALRDVAVNPSTLLPGRRRSSGRSSGAWSSASFSPSATPTSITSRNTTIATATTTAIA